MARTAGDVLTAAVRAQVDAIAGAQDAVRRDVPDAVHRQRVAVRRLRALLRSNARCFAPGEPDVADLVERLAAYSRALGDARDAEVQRARLAELARDLIPASSAQVRDGFVTLDDALSRQHAVARAHLIATLDSAEHADLLHRLLVLAEDPPLGERAHRPAAATLRAALGRCLARVRRRGVPLAARPDPADVHRLRKATRRARYAAEVLASSGGGTAARRAHRTASRLHRLQDALGTVHDADTLRATLADLRDPRTGATVDVCDAAEERRAADALAACPALLRRVP